MWSDTESDKDYLNFGEVSQIASDIINSPSMLPVSIGIFGNWGAGKSSVLKLIEKELYRESGKFVVIKFDAWLYQGYDDARAALLEVIATDLLKATEGSANVFEKAKRLISRVNIFRALGFAAEGMAFLAGIPTGGLIARGVSGIAGITDGINTKDEFNDLKALGKDAKEAASDLIRPEERKTPPQQIAAFRKEYEEVLDDLAKPLVVIIDNLDRCLPAHAIQTLEAIRLFLFLKNTAFVIAADEDMIRSSVADYFKGASERHQIDYLDKLIQIPIRVPKAGVREIRSYLFMLYAIDQKIPEQYINVLRDGLETALQQSWKEDPITKQAALALTGQSETSALAVAFDRADRIAHILTKSPIINGNPRSVKRLLNVVKMRSLIATRRSMPIDEAIITKLVIFERCVGDAATVELYRLIDSENGKPEIIKVLEKSPDHTPPTKMPTAWSNNPSVQSFIMEWSKLEPLLGNIDLRPAIYLSRETVPLGSYMSGLSPTGREALKLLVETANKSSPAAKGIIGNLPQEDQIPVMEGIVEHLRQVTDWTTKPKGFSGGCLLADHSAEAAKVFLRFISNIEYGSRKPPWLTTSLKVETWSKGK